MKSEPKVAIGIVSYGPQPPSFWLPYSESIATLHKYGIDFDGTYWKGSCLVDANRNAVVHEWLKAERSDWLWWIDADNPPPIGALQRLLELDKPMVSGVYYSVQKKEIISPIAYWVDHERNYHPVRFEAGELLQIDAVGMGCFLTHRDVYTTIMEEYTLYQRVLGGAVLVRNNEVRGKVPERRGNHPYAGQIKGGMYYEPVVQFSLPDADFPFFMSQFGRTEDFPFCELVREVGCEIWLDTSVESPHVKEHVLTGEDYRDQKRPDPAPEEVECV